MTLGRCPSKKTTKPDANKTPRKAGSDYIVQVRVNSSLSADMYVKEFYRMKLKFERAQLLRRFVVCTVGMFFYAAGAALTKNCDMGISPIVSVIYVMSLVIPISMGWCNIIYNFFMFGVQRLLLKKDYTFYMMAAQLLVSVIFSIFFDSVSLLCSFVTPMPYIIRFLIYIFGCFILGFGIIIVVRANFVVLPAEGVVNAIVGKTGWKFGNVKIAFDASMVLLTAIIGLVFLGGIRGIREGTLIAILLIGTFSKVSDRFVSAPISRFLRRPETEG